MAVDEWFHSFTWLGVIMILLGVLFVLAPYLARYVPEIEKLPPLLIYVYRRNGFYFATSPILLAISILWLIVSLLSRGSR